MERENTFRYLVSGYYGIREIYNYDLRIYILKEIEEYITSFVLEKYNETFDYIEEARNIEEKHSLKQKLNNSLIVLREIDAPMELIVLVKRKIEEIKQEEMKNIII